VKKVLKPKIKRKSRARSV